ATTGAPRANGSLPNDSGNHRQCRWSGETGRRDRRTFDPRDASSGQSNDGKLGQQSRKNPRRTIKAEGALGWRTQKKTLKWWCVFGAVSVSERVWQADGKNYLRLLPQAIGVTALGRSR